MARTPTERRGSRDKRGLAYDLEPAARSGRPIRSIIIALVVLAALLVTVLIGFIVLSGTSAFTIASIDAEPTEHLSAENIAKLANVEEGTTLLNMDEAAIEQSLRRNPWVGGVSFVREFPDRLRIVVTERRVDCVVKMSSGLVCWLLGDDSVWIEPVNLSVGDGQSSDDVALALAQDMEALLVTDVPTSLSPSAGETCTDEVIRSVMAYREQFSEDFNAQIVRFSASSVESISCTLKSGVEVSLGAPTNIDIKETVITQLLEKHPNQITYINVRVPSQPSYRQLGSESVVEGTGVTLEGLGGAGGDDGTVPQGDGSEPLDTDADVPQQGEQGDGDAQGQGSPQDGSDLILGEDGVYYTYEQYWGLDG